MNDRGLNMRAVGIIPARYHSTRFPGKPLIDIWGKPMIQHVYERACRCPLLSEVIVATDDVRIYNAVRGFGGQATLTSPDHHSGTDRVAEVARDLEVDLVVNIQGDEPLLEPETIDQLLQPFLRDDGVLMATLVRRANDPLELEDPNSAKVVVDKDGFALYFSRAPIPYHKSWDQGENPTKLFKQIGIYAYRKDFLLQFTALDPSPLELIEGLEQLRALENGYRIKVVETEYAPIDVDTWEDLLEVREILKKGASNP